MPPVKLCLVTNAANVIAPVDPTKPFGSVVARAYVHELTKNQLVCYGYNAWQAMGQKPLPDRFNFLITKDAEAHHEEAAIIAGNVVLSNGFVDLYDFLKSRGEVRNLWVLGGPELMMSTLHWVDELVFIRVDGDTSQPEGAVCVDTVPGYELASSSQPKKFPGITVLRFEKTAEASELLPETVKA
jgi:dihydrofolate reductase